MLKGKVQSYTIKCPFYRTQDKISIGCEGPFEGAFITLRFETTGSKDAQRSIFCDDQFKRCEIYRCIMANRYPEES